MQNARFWSWNPHILPQKIGLSGLPPDESGGNPEADIH